MSIFFAGFIKMNFNNLNIPFYPSMDYYNFYMNQLQEFTPYHGLNMVAGAPSYHLGGLNNYYPVNPVSYHLGAFNNHYPVNPVSYYHGNTSNYYPGHLPYYYGGAPPMYYQHLGNLPSYHLPVQHHQPQEYVRHPDASRTESKSFLGWLTLSPCIP